MDTGCGSGGIKDGTYFPVPKLATSSLASQMKLKQQSRRKRKPQEKRKLTSLDTIQYRSFDRTISIYHYHKTLLPLERFTSDFIKPDLEYIETRTHHDPLATFRSDKWAPLLTRIPEGDEMPEDVYEVAYLERPFSTIGARQGSAVAFRDGRVNKVTWFCFSRRIQRDLETIKIDESGKLLFSKLAHDSFSSFEAAKREWSKHLPLDPSTEPLVALPDSVKAEIDEVDGGQWLFEQVATLEKGAKSGVRGHLEHRVWYESLRQAKKEPVPKSEPKVRLLLKGHNCDDKKDGVDEYPLVHFSSEDNDAAMLNYAKENWT